MRRAWNACAALLLLSVACSDDDNGSVQSGVDAGSLDPTGSAQPDGGPQGNTDASTDPSKGSSSEVVPPAEQNGKRLYAVRFDLRAGDAEFGCGKPAPLGLTQTRVDPLDARFFVHDVVLVRANGERVPLDLHQDGRWQRNEVALIDFADDTGKCATGDAATRKVVYGYAPAQSDYTGVSFKLGVPERDNHIDGASAPAPYNASGMWWTWSGGYKYIRLDLTSDVMPFWYLHSGAAGCSGSPSGGFKCAARQIATIDLIGWDANSSVVVFDAAKFYAGVDLSKAADELPGCMGTKGDTECDPLLNALGLVPWDDAAPRPTQTVFQIRSGTPWTLPTTNGISPVRRTNDPNVWPDPAYVRNPALDIENISSTTSNRSHPKGDARFGVSCMRCHQQNGPGLGQFSAAGSVVDHEGKPAKDVKIEIVSGTPDRASGTLLNLVSHALLDVDQNGNFYTTKPLPYAQQPLTARILDLTGKQLAFMKVPKQSGACNTCHTGSFQIHVPPPGEVH